MTPAKKRATVGLFLWISGGWSAGIVGAEQDGASALAARTVESMGGAEAWEATRYLRFNFFGARLHHWDRYSGHHRLEGGPRYLPRQVAAGSRRIGQEGLW